MRQQSQKRVQKPRSVKQSKEFDYNKPISKCNVCYTLCGWHCYECSKIFVRIILYNIKTKDNLNDVRQE